MIFLLSAGPLGDHHRLQRSPQLDGRHHLVCPSSVQRDPVSFPAPCPSTVASSLTLTSRPFSTLGSPTSPHRARLSRAQPSRHRQCRPPDESSGIRTRHPSRVRSLRRWGVGADAAPITPALRAGSSGTGCSRDGGARFGECGLGRRRWTGRSNASRLGRSLVLTGRVRARGKGAQGR